METLIINIPEKKIAIVKQLLKELGVTMQKTTATKRKPSEFLGSISKEKAKNMLLHVENSRQEWERNT